MQNLVNIYENNEKIIKKFILSSLQRLSFDELNANLFTELKEVFPSLELLYVCDENLIQNSPNYEQQKEDISQVGQSRAYLIEGQNIEENLILTDPYISGKSGSLCITVIKYENGSYIFLDFKIQNLLERFHLIESDTVFRQVSRFSYSLMGGGLILFGLFVVIYGIGSFLSYLFSSAQVNLEIIFKPVIALTLGLAVFDLGKTIIEQEVLESMQKISEQFDPKSLITFLVSIIIALLIEALLIVFKIAINDYTQLHYASGLIIALSILLYVFSLFITKNRGLEK